MTDKIALELGPVQKTMLLPLWGRARETQKARPALEDKAALEIVRKIDFDFTGLSEKISEVTRMGWIARCIQIDRMATAFLEKYPRATIVNIGCGLDTTFERIDNGRLRWYDLDLADVIRLRSALISENDRRTFLAASFLETGWLDQLEVTDHVFFMAAGVFYYFEEPQIRGFFNRLAQRFPGSELVFDASSAAGIKLANQVVIRSSGLDEKSYLKWGLGKASQLRTWNERIRILEEHSLFRNVPLKPKHRLALLISDLFNMQYIIHLKFQA